MVPKKTLTAGTFAGPDTDCVAGNEVKDALMWPLSTKEANAVNTDLRIVDPEDTGFDNSWWLRSPGAEGGSAADVFGYGVVNFSGNPVIEEYASGVRPAFDLNLESVLFTSAAESGKSSGATGGDALSAIADNTTNEWKLTLKDANRNGFKASAAAGATLEVGAGYSDWRVPVVYSGAETGNNEYVSVILCDSNGTAKYYGNIAKNSAASSASGQAVRIPSGLAEGDYTMYVFNEQINEDRMTDYASDFSTIDLTVEKLVPVSIEDAIIVLSWTTVTYNGKVQKPTVKTVEKSLLTRVWIQ